METYAVAIVGAGPAGLAAAQRLSRSGHRVVLIDRGHDIAHRQRDLEADLTQGHGGAGLYSDGKFSFFPSATQLWQLPRESALRSAYAWTCELLEAHGLQTPPFPEHDNTYQPDAEAWGLKSYPSNYLSLQARETMTRDLVANIDVDIATRTQVVTHRYEPQAANHVLQLRRDGEDFDIAAGALIWATGRFGALGMNQDIETVFRRLEVGLRIDQASDRAFFQHFPNLDPKLTLRNAKADLEWRTFCACRNGATVLTRTQDLWTVSGHSDGPATGRSNVGFNTRVLDAAVAAEAVEALSSALRKDDAHFELSLVDWLQGDPETGLKIRAVYGEALAESMLLGLRQLVDSFPAIEHPDTRLIGPTLEGIGWYPAVDGELRVDGLPLWIPGDASGLFRGIVAAFVSGHYAASSVLETLSTPALSTSGASTATTLEPKDREACA